MLAHHSQHTAALANFREFQRSRFGKDIVLIDASFSDLGNPKVVRELIQRFHYAMDNHLPLFMPSEFSKNLILEYILACQSEPHDSYRPKETLKYQLATLIDLIRKHAIFCKDEIDTLLLTTTDTRVPVGDKIPLSGEQIDLIGLIYECLLSDELKDLVRLETNEQKQLSQKDYEETVVKRLAEKVFDTFLGGIQYGNKEVCLRHLMHRITIDDQELAVDPQTVTANILDETQRQNVLFLKELFRMQANGANPEKLQTKYIGWARKIIKEFLPQALSRSYNQHYGSGCTKPGQQSNGNPVPYNSVDNPATAGPPVKGEEPKTTEFGHKVFKALVAMQMAIQRPIDAAELGFLRDNYRSPMMLEAAIKGIHPSQTPEGRQFERMTSVPILDLNNPNQMEKALSFVNADPLRRLAIRKESAGYHVGDYEYEIRMNANDMESLPLSYIGGSGTLIQRRHLQQSKSSRSR